MAVFITDFSEYSIGSPPSDWSVSWGSGPMTISNEAWIYEIGNTLKWGYTPGTDTKLAVNWNTVPLTANMEILCLVNNLTVPADNSGIQLYIRESGTAYSNRNGYYLNWINNTFSTALFIKKVLNGSETTLVTKNIIVSDNLSKTLNNGGYWLRFKALGNTLQAKAWDATQAEPSNWTITATDSSILTSGKIKLNRPLFSTSINAYTGYCYYFAVATAGESLPVPDTYSGDILFGSPYDINQTTTTIPMTTKMHGGLLTQSGRYEVGGTFYGATSGLKSVRAAIYSGGTLTDPTGAVLVADLGSQSFNGNAVFNLASATISLPAGVIWLAVRSNFNTSSRAIASNSYILGNWYSSDTVGYYTWNPASTDASEAFPAIMPGGGSFNNSSFLRGFAIKISPASGGGIPIPPAEPPVYTDMTLAAFKGTVAQLLQDPDNIYWTDPASATYITELESIINEALHTFSYYTWFWRTKLTITTIPGQNFYDIYNQNVRLLGNTYLDRDVINLAITQLQENLISSWTTSNWNNSVTTMFNSSEIATSIENRVNRFIGETGVIVARNISTLTLSDGQIDLPADCIDVRRLAWTDTGNVNNLWRVNEEELTAFNQSWDTSGTPLYYSVLASQQGKAQLAPPPTVAAVTDLLYTNSVQINNPFSSGTPILVPDDYMWIIKWGVMADLLSKEGPAYDPERAKYCKQRYDHAVAMLKYHTHIISAHIDDTSTSVSVSTLEELDAYNSNWQNDPDGTSTIVASAGINQIVLYPAPAVAGTVTLDIVRNAVLPADDTDFIQLSRDMYGPIIDYIKHLALFKVGGAEFINSMSLLEAFFDMTSNYNRKMEAASRLWKDLNKVTNAEELTRLRIRPQAVSNTR